MGFPYYIIILKDEKIWNSYKLSLKKELNTGNKGIENPNLVRILIIVKTVLRDMY